jgi:hypothetical protein
MYRSLAALFACCVVTACGSGGPSNFSNNPPPPPPATNLSLQFFGTGGGVDRVKVPLLDASGAARPVNIGATDFTLEFWIKGNVADNPTAGCTTGQMAKDAWLTGAVVLDRDVLGDGDLGEYGVSLLGGQVAFGVSLANGGQTLCGVRNVLDGNWHHVALTRRSLGGLMTIFVDGAQEISQGNVGSGGDVSYNPAHVVQDPTDPLLVVGAQKRDDASAHAFHGLIDELRLSTTRRYVGPFTPLMAAFVVDTDTAALYHFDEASGTDIIDASATSLSPGVLVPAPAAAGSNRSTDVPF